MDKLNKYLVVLKKYQFWAICGIVSLAALICYVAASSGLAKQTSERTKKLEGEFNALKIEPNHPNQAVIEAIQKQHSTLKRGVSEAWEILYREQKKNNPLPAVLDKDFKTHFENLKPKEELPSVYREQYQNFIRNELPTLLTLVDARRPPDDKGQPAGGGVPKGGPAGARRPAGQAMPGRGGVAAAEDDWIGIVDWTDFPTLESGFDWPTKTPSTLDVVLAQENLWVIQALLRVIHRTNDGATSNATAAVKRIDALQIGQAAAAAWKHAVAAASVGVAGGKSDGGSSKGSSDASSVKAGAAGEAGDRQRLIEGRYLDDKGEPVSFTEDAPHYAAHPNEEFVMMPIRMVLLMDQRKVPKLLVECANSSMPIEVRQVHLTKTPGGVLDFDSGGRGGAKSGGSRGGDDSKGGRGGYVAPARASAVRAAPGAEQTEGSPYDLPVEILGVIYIYNPPVTGTASTEPAVEGATPAAPAPAAATGKNP